jgi:multidrug resistance protein, MATE family
MKRVWAMRPTLWPRSQSAAVPGEEPIGPVVNRLAWPVIVENLLQTLLGMVDLVFIGALGAAAVAGSGSAIQVLWVIQSGFAAITTGTTVLVAHAIGAQRPEQANRVLKQSIMVGVILSLVVGVLGHYLAAPIIAALGAAPDVVEAGAVILSIGASTSVFMTLMLIIGAALRGAGDSKTPMLAALLTNGLNAVLAWALIFGKLGLPALGLAGSAWATAIARAVGVVMLLWALNRGRGALKLNWRSSWRFDSYTLGRTLQIGIPSMAEMLLMSGGMLVYSMFAIRLGTQVFAAQRITFNLISFSFMLGMGYAIAATTLTGQSLGAKKPNKARQATAYASWSALGFMSALAVLMFIFGPQLMRIFTSDPELIQIGAESLKVIAFAQPFHAIGQVLAGTLRGAGDTRYAMYATAAAIWVVRLPLAYLLGPVLHLSLAAIYASNVIDAAVRLGLLWRRYRQDRWVNIKV